jgi:hypothetical protein
LEKGDINDVDSDSCLDAKIYCLDIILAACEDDGDDSVFSEIGIENQSIGSLKRMKQELKKTKISNKASEFSKARKKRELLFKDAGARAT